MTFRVSRHDGVTSVVALDDVDEGAVELFRIADNSSDLPDFNTVHVGGCADHASHVPLNDVPDGSFLRLDARMLCDLDAAGREPADAAELLSMLSAEARGDGDPQDLLQRVRKHRYLVHTPADGDLKPLLFCRRLLFLAGHDDRLDDADKRYWERDLRAWVHYVPVASDLSDLLCNVDRVRSDPGIESRIVESASQFAWRHLTRDACTQRWRDVIREVADKQRADPVQPIFALTLYTENYADLFRVWHETLPDNFEPVAMQLDLAEKWNIFGFQTRSWYDIIRIKINFFADFLTKRPDGVLAMCSDSDIMFLNSSSRLSDIVRDKFAKSPELDIWIMEESPGIVNGGFYIVRNSCQVREFLRRAANSCFKRTPLADQDFINAHIRECLVTETIPMTYIVPGKDVQVAKEPLVHHAIGCSGLQSKLDQQQLVRQELAKHNSEGPTAPQAHRRTLVRSRRIRRR